VTRYRPPSLEKPRLKRERRGLSQRADRTLVAKDIGNSARGTLADAVMPTRRCWREILAEFGFSVWLLDLHRYSGMFGGEMLDFSHSRFRTNSSKRSSTDTAGAYRQDYLPGVQAFPGASWSGLCLHIAGRDRHFLQRSPGRGGTFNFNEGWTG
jgi:hypothetical protein